MLNKEAEISQIKSRSQVRFPSLPSWEDGGLSYFTCVICDPFPCYLN